MVLSVVPLLNQLSLGSQASSYFEKHSVVCLLITSTDIIPRICQQYEGSLNFEDIESCFRVVHYTILNTKNNVNSTVNCLAFDGKLRFTPDATRESVHVDTTNQSVVPVSTPDLNVHRIMNKEC